MGLLPLLPIVGSCAGVGPGGAGVSGAPLPPGAGEVSAAGSAFCGAGDGVSRGGAVFFSGCSGFPEAGAFAGGASLSVEMEPFPGGRFSP